MHGTFVSAVDSMTDSRIEALRALESPCRLCPRECRARRGEGEVGYCSASATAVVASFGPHFGEESVLVGTGGSGTVFFSPCNLKCAFCQNYDIAHRVSGAEATPAQIARIMLSLAARGCENVNFVTPTLYAPQIAEATILARDSGFALPTVYNCGGYESLDALRLLDGLVDIYMPDAKFLDARASARYLNAPNYPQRMCAALVEMQRQVGDLVLRRGAAARGLLVRHLVMPGHTEDSKAVIAFLASEVSPHAYVNIMGQYHPQHRASDFPEIDRCPTRDEVYAVRAYALEKGLRLDM